MHCCHFINFLQSMQQGRQIFVTSKSSEMTKTWRLISWGGNLMWSSKKTVQVTHFVAWFALDTRRWDLTQIDSMHYWLRWSVRFWNMGKVPKSELFFLARFNLHNKKLLIWLQNDPNIVSIFLGHFFTSKIMEKLR